MRFVLVITRMKTSKYIPPIRICREIYRTSKKGHINYGLHDISIKIPAEINIYDDNSMILYSYKNGISTGRGVVIKLSY